MRAHGGVSVAKQHNTEPAPHPFLFNGSKKQLLLCLFCFSSRPSRLDCGLESRVYRQRFSTIDAPCSLYSEREIHSCWNDPSEAMMEPPIHGACRRSSPVGFRNRDLYVELSVFTSSFCRRGANPGNRLLPPDMII